MLRIRASLQIPLVSLPGRDGLLLNTPTYLNLVRITPLVGRIPEVFSSEVHVVAVTIRYWSLHNPFIKR